MVAAVQAEMGTFNVLIGMPAMGPVVFLQIRRHSWMAKRIVGPMRACGMTFPQRIPYWVIVHLKDQRRIGRLYADRSFASHSPAPPEILFGTGLAGRGRWWVYRSSN